MQDLFTYQNNFLDDLINYYVTNVENYNDWSSWEDGYHVVAFFDKRLPEFLMLEDKEHNFIIDNLNLRMPHKPHRHMNRNYFSKLSIYLLKRDLGMDYKLNKQEY
jgi:hypothetical protein